MVLIMMDQLNQRKLNIMTQSDTTLKFEVDIATLRKTGIFVATPMYGGMCYGSYTNSMMELAVLCAQHGIPLGRKFLYNESLVQRARNYIADAFMETNLQQMIFIDSDIDFTAQDVIIMADLQNKNPEYDVICGPYPKKMIAWEKIKAVVDKGLADQDPNVLENYVGDYVFNTESGVIKLAEPAKIMEAGTGFMMIRRQTFEKFREAYPEQNYLPDHIRTKGYDGSRQITAFFDCIIDPVSRRYLSEDYYFCQQVRKAGMNVYLCPWMQMGHNGYYRFGGSVAALAAAGQNVTVDTDKIKK